MNIELVKRSIRTIPDFPKPGIHFKDITTAYQDKKIFNFIVNQITSHYESFGITKVIGIESRGFVIGSILAYKLNAGFIPIRKPGKLPAEKFTQTYELEYGIDTLEIHQNAIKSDDIILIHDDVLATGGTMEAAINLVKNFGISNIRVNFFLELEFLKGLSKIDKNIPVYSFIHL